MPKTTALEKGFRKDPYNSNNTIHLPPDTYPADVSLKILLTEQRLSKLFNDFPKWPEGICSESPKQKIGHGVSRYKKLPGCP